MRQVVVDYARERLASKRGGGRIQVELTEKGLIDLEQPESLVAMDDALRWLEQHDSRLVELIHLRVYVGLELEMIAPLLEVTPRQLQRDWQRARAWMTEALLHPVD
jgi:RNA polymerase sigma factor (TIGR02999 family)